MPVPFLFSPVFFLLAQTVIQYLPVLIGWFSLNVPSALGIYWLANNLSTTGSSFAIKAYVSIS